METRYSYNGANWVTEVENRQNGALLSSYSYTYYASGSQASKTDHTGSHTTYRYDGLGRLTEESESGGVTLQYQYDAAGNRTGLVCSGVESYSVSYAYDSCNRLLQETRSMDGETSLTHYTYDANGNLLTKVAPSAEVGGEQVQVCSYNGFGQLTGLTVNSVGAAYAYNARGIRTSKQVGPIRTAYVLDGGSVACEVEGGQVTASYTRGMNLLSAEMGGEESYYLYNAHGDVVQLTSPAGDVTRSYAYDAFGSERTRDEGDANPFRYCGEYYDGETGTYYLRARYYDPALGRFTQQDTYPGNPKDPLSLNYYVYCYGNPLRYRDPSGNIPIETILDIASIGDSLSNLLEDPNLLNAAYLVWDVASALMPYVPGSYVAKGARLVGNVDDISDLARAFARVDNLADAASTFVRNSDSIVMSYRELKKTVKSLNISGLEVHHLIEKRFANTLGIKENDMLSVALDKDTHKEITKLFRQKIGYAFDLQNPNRTNTVSAQKIWKVTVEVYTEMGMEEYLPVLQQHLLNGASNVGDIERWIIN